MISRVVVEVTAAEMAAEMAGARRAEVILAATRVELVIPADIEAAATRVAVAGEVAAEGRRFPHVAGTLLYDAVFLGSDELMSKQKGRKAVIILSDGVDTGSKFPLERAVEASQRADTIVYSILFSDESAYGGRGGFGGFGGMGRGGGKRQEHPDGKKVLERISNETGGRMFEVSKKQTLEKIYSEIEEELRSQYSLGYSPDRADLAPGYHKIVVKTKTKDKDLKVQARDGYYLDR